MWLSKQTRPGISAPGADLGVTSISGESAGVVTRGEVRALPVYGPGGYAWRPAAGETVLVIKGGTGGEESCVAGAKQTDAPAGLRPGEVYIHANGGSVYLKNDGTVELQGSIVLTGQVKINGALHVNGELYKPCACGGESE
ncbi:hypothetical protein [Oscillibacter sp. GMB15532]|uniref:hypothetical protein n=1 Tax=Oscillibacter sp. GMB15532 TaxID=3230022 RepID=UPI0034DE86BB